MTGAAPRWETGIAAVIPCYRVGRHVLPLLAAIGPEVERIYCVDDACPDGSGDVIAANTQDPRVVVLRHAANQGVGGAVVTGYRQAIADGARVIVKLDGDGQMDPALVPAFVEPLLAGEADYAKGNRFWDLGRVRAMPAARRLGNLGLSFLAKASTGYWDVFDPTNGYTAIHAGVAARLPLERVARRYFFESDLLYQLNLQRACVVDVPMEARYGDEVSHLSLPRALFEFPLRHLANAARRVFYNYFFREMSVGSMELLAAVALLGFGAAFGGLHWAASAQAGVATPVGTIMIATVAVISGLQFLLAFLSYDVSSVPRRAIHRALSRRPAQPGSPSR